MNRAKRILATCMSIVLLMSCLCVEAFAASDVYSYTGTMYGETTGGYLAIGDSIGFGMGTDYWYTNIKGGDEPAKYANRNIPGSYPTEVAKAVGCTFPEQYPYKYGTASYKQKNGTTACNFYPCTFEGFTLAGLIGLLGLEDLYGDAVSSCCDASGTYNHKVLPQFGSSDSYDPENRINISSDCGDYSANALVKSAGLITIEVGMCDVFWRPLSAVSEDGLIFSGGFDLSKLVKTPEDAIKLVAALISEAYDGFNYWKDSFPKVLEYIVSNNPSATIVVVGSYNPAAGTHLLDDSFLALGDAFAGITAAMNRFYRQWANQYENVVYADISNVIPCAAENGWSVLNSDYLTDTERNGIMDSDYLDDTEIASHPTQSGHDLITRAILKALEGQSSLSERNNIVVDLGIYGKTGQSLKYDRTSKTAVVNKEYDYSLRYVLVNGLLAPGAKIDENGMLTVPYLSALGRTLTVCTKDANTDKIAVSTYQLVYRPGQGYSAYRIYSTGDAVETIHSISIEGLVQRSTNLINVIKDLVENGLPL